MKIISNTAISLDGKIATAFEPMHFMGSAADQKRMLELRDLADAILVGGNTFRNWPHPRLPWSESRSPLLNVILTQSGEIELSKDFLEEPRIEPLILTSNKKLAGAFSVETLVCPESVTPVWMVEELKRRDVQTLLIEGGGEILFPFLEQKLLHEMHVTVCPQVIGGRSAPSLVAGTGFTGKNLPQLELLECLPVGSEIFLHYRVL